MAITIERIECWVHRAPIREPVANSFRAMTDRPAVWVRLTDSEVERWYHGDGRGQQLTVLAI